MQQQNTAISTLVDIYKQCNEALFSQRVPTRPELWSTERYRDFLKARREALTARMNASIREKSGTA